MCELTKSTFNQNFPEIEKAIRECKFVAIDTEFTGLRLEDDDSKPSLFDDPPARYKKLHKTVKQITICQIGISTFTKDPNDNSKYEAKTFNFPLFPEPFGPVDTNFVCQASSMTFLRRYMFDFNKWVNEGISYLNEDQERAIRDHIASRAMFTGLERDLDEKAVQHICSQVAEWITTCPEGDTMTIEKKDMNNLPMYVLNTELRARFPNIWTTIADRKQIVIEVIAADDRQKHEEQESTTKKDQSEELVQKLLGFTRVFRVLTECKKPLVGHNMFNDLLLIYDKFHLPLPSTYTEFKKNIHTLFPKIYDTKHIVAVKRKSLVEFGVLQRSDLGGVYNELESGKGREIVIHCPCVQHVKDHDRYVTSELPHEAGYDAYMCGFSFLRLAHINTFEKTKSSDVVPCLFQRYIQDLEPYVNKINIIRASSTHLCLDQADPATHRPELLIVQSRNMTQKLNIDQLATWFSPYGSVDVRRYGRDRALVASSVHRCAKDILKSFKNHNTIKITKYSFWKHSPAIRPIILSGVIITGGLCAWALLANNKKPTPLSS